jgi:hypothetical protein
MWIVDKNNRPTLWSNTSTLAVKVQKCSNCIGSGDHISYAFVLDQELMSEYDCTTIELA